MQYRQFHRAAFIAFGAAVTAAYAVAFAFAILVAFAQSQYVAVLQKDVCAFFESICILPVNHDRAAEFFAYPVCISAVIHMMMREDDAFR